MFEIGSFKNPELLWLLAVLLPLLVWFFVFRHKDRAGFNFSYAPNTKKYSQVNNLSKLIWKLRPFLFFLRLLGLATLIIALARPQTSSVSTRTKTTKGIDIVLAIDVSSSMLAKDLKPNRLSALKKVAAEFVGKRPNDRIGLVVYAGESYTKTPVTSDKIIVDRSLQEVNYGDIEDGTAIGMGLATAVNRIKDSKALSKVIILLTDGVNNAGFIEPQTAADLALEYNIKTYTIGLGTNGNAMTPVAYNPDGTFRYGLRPVEIDEELLEEIASLTGGQYFRATDNSKLEEIYEEINKLEKTEIEEFTYYSYEEHYRSWLILGLVLLLLEWLLKHSLYKSVI